jgi:hypothetical protein
VGKFVRVGQISFVLLSSLTALCETTDHLTGGRTACLTGLSAESGEREHGAAGNKPIKGTAQTATSVRKKMVMEKRRDWGTRNIAKSTVNGGCGELRGQHPNQSHPQIPRTVQIQGRKLEKKYRHKRF